jgi:hypothetical protein
MQCLPSLFERVTDEGSPATFATDFCINRRKKYSRGDKRLHASYLPCLVRIDVVRAKLPRTKRKVIPALHRTPAALSQLNFATISLLKLRRKNFASTRFLPRKAGCFEREAASQTEGWHSIARRRAAAKARRRRP